MKINTGDVLAVVRGFVNGQGGAGEQIEMETALLQDGYLDSFALVQLIAELEQQLGLNISPGMLIPEDFESVRVLSGRLEQI